MSWKGIFILARITTYTLFAANLSLKILYAEPAVAFAALGFIKLGILFFYKRIFTIRYFTITSNVFITLVTVWTIGALVVSSAADLSTFVIYYLY